MPQHEGPFCSPKADKLYVKPLGEKQPILSANSVLKEKSLKLAFSTTNRYPMGLILSLKSALYRAFTLCKNLFLRIVYIRTALLQPEDTKAESHCPNAFQGSTPTHPPRFRRLFSGRCKANNPLRKIRKFGPKLHINGSRTQRTLCRKHSRRKPDCPLRLMPTPRNSSRPAPRRSIGSKRTSNQ